MHWQKAPIGVWLINWLDHPKSTNGNYTHRILEPHDSKCDQALRDQDFDMVFFNLKNIF